MKDIKINQNNNILMNIRGPNILKLILNNLTIEKSLKIIRYNKFLIDKSGKSLNDFKKYLQTEIKIEIEKNQYGKFINILEEESHFFIFILMII